MSLRQTVVMITALAATVLIGAGLNTLTHASTEEVARRAATTTSAASTTTAPLPDPVRVEGATASRALNALDDLIAARHEVGWLRLEVAGLICQRDTLAAELDARAAGVAPPSETPATCSRP